MMPQVPGNTIPGAGGYGSYPGNPYRYRYVWITMPDGEIRHLAVTAGIGLIARNPYVSIGVGVLHGLSHVFEPGHHPAGPSFTEWITGTYDPSPGLSGGGGPGTGTPTSTDPSPSLEEAGKILIQGNLDNTPTGLSYGASRKAGGSRHVWRGNRPRRPARKRCKPGYRWNGHRCVPKY